MCRAFLHRIPLLPFHSATHPYSAVSPAVTAACRLLAVSPRGYTFPSACCDLSTADPFRLVLRQITGRGGTDQTRTGGFLIPNQARCQLRYGSIFEKTEVKVAPRRSLSPVQADPEHSFALTLAAMLSRTR